MRVMINNIVQQRNSSFQLDKNVDGTMLLNFSWLTFLSMLRSIKLILRAKNPRLAMIGKSVKFSHINRIHFGKYLKLGDGVHLSGLGKAGVILGDNVGIGAYSRVVASTSLNNLGVGIKIGNNVGIGEFAYLGGGGGLTIGDDCIVGQYFSCHPENHNYADSSELIRLQGVSRRGIVIGSNCWVGSKVTILDGVSIGDNCIIAAGAVVNQSFPSNCVIGGVPAKILKTIK